MHIGTLPDGFAVNYAKRPSRTASWYPAGYDLSREEADTLREELHDDGFDTMLTDEAGEVVE